MDVEYAFIADAAQVVQNKLYVMGGNIDHIFATGFPTKHLAMAFVVAFRFHPSECNRQHEIDIQLWDADGKTLIGIKGQVSAEPQKDDPTRATVVPFVMDIVLQEFPKAGTYGFYVIMNGEHKKRVPLYLTMVKDE